MRHAVIVFVLSLVLAAPAVAGCKDTSLTVLTAVQAASAFSIAKYTWAGDPQYDQWFSGCAKTALREFGCQAGLNLAFRYVERKADSNDAKACVLNYLAALGIGYINRNALSVQLFHLKL